MAQRMYGRAYASCCRLVVRASRLEVRSNIALVLHHQIQVQPWHWVPWRRQFLDTSILRDTIILSPGVSLRLFLYLPEVDPVHHSHMTHLIAHVAGEAWLGPTLG
jgi:hypothetical protein